MKTFTMNRRDLLQGAGLIAAEAVLPSNLSAGTAMADASLSDPSRAIGNAIVAGKNTAIVETTYGKLAGYTDRGVFAFKGIPYGATTAGAGRFKAPTPPKSWTGVRSSRAFGPQAPQAYRSVWENDEEAFLFQWDYGYSSEDCLRLNVWTPSLEGKRRPVLLYLHGGGYTVGSSQELKMFDGVNLARRGDVVLVTINHRLNVLGYLNLAAYGDEYAESGNAGSLDTVAALRWVRDNIAQFGGDPESVTIFGQSGGGGKVSTLLAMPSARGLFHKAIVESGPTLRIGTEERSRELAERTLKRLGIAPADVKKLEDIPYAQLEKAATAEIGTPTTSGSGPRNPFRNMARGLGFSPVMDGKVVAQHPFDPEPPPSASNIPLMIGTTLNEFTHGINHPEAFEMTQSQLTAKVEESFAGHSGELIASYRELYPAANPFQLWSVISTAGVRDATVAVAERKATQVAPVYCYQFAWQAPVLDGRPMAFHCSELAFVFDNSDLCEHMTGGGEAARILASRVSQVWVNFARTGNPNHAGLPAWKKFEAATKTTMVFDNHCKATDNLDTKQLALMSSLYLKV
jgi:para-nitrobenzyl esterase